VQCDAESDHNSYSAAVEINRIAVNALSEPASEKAFSDYFNRLLEKCPETAWRQAAADPPVPDQTATPSSRMLPKTGRI